MGKIRERLLRARSSISVKTYKRPMIAVISMMIMINIVVLAIAAIIAMAIDPNYSNFIDAFANGSLKWMLTPNAILSIENPETLSLAVVVLIIGMVLFSGTIIALTTNQIKEYFQRKKSGSGRIILSNHIVILNWNEKVPELVADLLHVDIHKYTVMILADIDKHYAEKQIGNAVSKLGETVDVNSIDVLVKNGDPLIRSNLNNISIEEAIAVIVMNRGVDENVTIDMTKSDLNVIKNILNLGQIDFEYNPVIVAEVKHHESKHKIETMSRVVESLSGKTIIPVCFDRRLGQIIAQTIIHSLMEDVYLAMFSFDGSEVYYLEDTDIDDCLKYHTDALPLARKDGGLFVLARNNELKNRKTTQEVTVEKLSILDYSVATNLDVYIIGSNNKLKFIEKAFYEYDKLYDIGFKTTKVEEDKILDFIDEINSSKKKVTILLLSDETQEEDVLDANVINNLIQLEEHIRRTDINVIVELLDPKNAVIIKDFNIENTIISNKIISLLLSKIALFPRTASFYENLLTLSIDETEDDHEVFIRKANKVYAKTPHTFRTKKSFILSSYMSMKESVIPFAIYRNDKLVVLSDDLHDPEPFEIRPDDDVIMMKL